MYVWVLLSLLLELSGRIPTAQAQQEPSVFQEPEMKVAPSPGEPRSLGLPPGERLMDFAASPAGPEVAVLTRSPAGQARVLLWKIASGQTETIWKSDGHFAPRALAWHPAARVLFLMGPSGSESVILRLEARHADWKPATIFRTKNSLSRLIVGPRPFVADSPDSSQFYRLFFGEAHSQGTFSIASVTEQGERYYQVTHPKEAAPPAPLTPDAEPPSPIVAEWALPEAFHPAGHILLWVDPAQCFQAAHYGRDDWEKSTPVWGGKICGGSIEPTPNGIGLLHWRKGTPGVVLYLSGQETATQHATQFNFTSVPLPTRDGRGLIGATRQGDTLSMVYAPVDMPLADVSNAWMFLESPNDRALMVQHAGLFRALKDQDQLFQLYDSENYYCGGYDNSTPTRPYLVTTDIFWENFAAAYEGLFILLERRQAIPAFWKLVREAHAALDKTNSPWAGIFRALDQLASKAEPDDPEAQRIMRAGGVEYSPVLDTNFNYGELKPRGHYTSGDQEERYFKAFRYLTSVASQFKKLPAEQLSSLPPAAQEHAREWIRPYLTFIAPSRAPLVWSGLPGAAPPYTRHPTPRPAPFPLSWAFDNEVLLSTVFHLDWPADKQITGPGSSRTLPSGLDVAAALGNRLAQTLLRPEIEKYPPLARALDDLKARAPVAGTYPPSNLYDRWIEALGTSWADSTGIPGEKAAELWDAKRLQTGLASWATLRHATVLVNERTVAECGEGGFEWIVLTPPRGYVEPAPDTLEAIAGLFDAAARAVRDASALSTGDLPSETEKVALREGLLRRLREASAKARVFGGIARKEIEGQPLSAGEYEEILKVGRAAEYDFLIFKSLANREFALSNPDPMAKVADVAGGARGIPYLECSVGAPLEWDQIVPFFGRREVVKGSVYSYYEFQSAVPLSDADWRARLPSEARPPWVTPYVSNETLSCPSRNPY